MQTTGRLEPTRFQVGDLEVDVGLQRVTRNGVDLLLPRLSFDLLLTLLRAAPNLVSNRQLLQLVWPGLVVSDKTVSQRIKLLRDSLGDSPGSPRYIGGLRGRGYRIVAPVAILESAGTESGAGSEEADTPAIEQPRHRKPANAHLRQSWPLAALTVAVVSAALLVLGPAWQRESATDVTGNGGSTPLTLAVLPFRESGDQATAEFIGPGLAEFIRERMSTVSGLDTIAPESSVKSAGIAQDPQQVAKQLGARFMLDGSAEQIGDRLKVSARLLDSESGRELWVNHFERPLSEIFAIQEEIVAQISHALLEAGVTSPPQSPVRLPGTTENVDAYLAYLRGRAWLGRWTILGARRAQQEFARAIALDPEFAAAYASLFDARMLAADRAAGGASPAAAARYPGESPVSAERIRNHELIEKAIALDPGNGAAYFARAIWASEDSGEREADFRRGLELDPGNGRGIVAYSEYLDRVGRPEEAQSMLDRALRIDPVSPRAHFRRAMRQFPVDPVRVKSDLARVLEMDPDYQPALQRYAKYVWMFDGDLSQAIPIVEHALALDPGNPWLTHTAVAMYLDLGDARSARQLVAAADRPEVSGDLLLALFDGQWRLAGEAAFNDAAFANGVHENWGVYEALRDWALATGEFDRALAALTARTGFPEAATDSDNFRAAPAIAQLLELTGQHAKARQLLVATIRWIDDYHLPNLSTVYALRVKAAALLLLGETELALTTLDASFRGGDYLQWWYTLERDPLWSPLRADPRFLEITARVRDHISKQGSALDHQRQQP